MARMDLLQHSCKPLTFLLVNKRGAHPFRHARRLLVCHQKTRGSRHLCQRFRQKIPKHKVLPLRFEQATRLLLHPPHLPPLSLHLLQFLSQNRFNTPRQHQISGIVLTVSHNRRSAPRSRHASLAAHPFRLVWNRLSTLNSTLLHRLDPPPTRTIMSSRVTVAPRIFQRLHIPSH